LAHLTGVEQGITMILPHIAQLNTKRIVLASGSPRRKELLKVLGLNKFEVGVLSLLAWHNPQTPCTPLLTASRVPSVLLR
jgi:hypothetical protein